MVNTSHASIVLTDPFPNTDTNLVATNPTSSSQVLMLSVMKPSTDFLVSMHNKDYGIQAFDQPTILAMNPSMESIPPNAIPELTSSHQRESFTNRHLILELELLKIII